MTKSALTISLIINLIFVLAFFYGIRKLGGFNYLRYKMNHRGLAGVYEHRKSQFDLLPLNDSSIVFLGNSITEQGIWSELTGNPNVRNRGIAGDVLEGVEDRLTQVVKYQPAKIFLMIGINDLIANDPAQIMPRYNTLVENIIRQSPNTKLYLQSILPVNNEVRPSGFDNADIIWLNEQIIKTAAQHNLQYIDLHRLLEDESGQLDAKYTRDGIHINGPAYLIWEKAIREWVQ